MKYVKGTTESPQSTIYMEFRDKLFERVGDVCDSVGTLDYVGYGHFIPGQFHTRTIPTKPRTFHT